MRRGHAAGRGELRALAQQHGFGSAEGRFVLGRFIVEGRDENGLPPAEGDYSPETVTTVPPTRMTVTPRVVRAPLPEPSGEQSEPLSLAHPSRGSGRNESTRW